VPVVLFRHGRAEETVGDVRRVCVEAPVGVPARGGGRSACAGRRPEWQRQSSTWPRFPLLPLARLCPCVGGRLTGPIAPMRRFSMELDEKRRCS
jgi:hypothetical protein